MANLINADPTNGLKLISDGSSEIQLQANGVTKATLSSAGFSSPGHVLQVVHFSDSGQEVTTSTTMVASGLTANITPSSTSSKILILMKAPVTNTTVAKQNNVTLYRDATDLAVGSEGMSFYYKSGTSYTWTEISMNYLDSPNTTSAVTYKCYFKARNGGTSYFGATESSRHLTLMEIAG
jgi:hypothetical protein